MNTRTLGIALVFVAGCAVGGVSSQIAVPKASAQQAATLTKWEVMCFSHNNDDRAVPQANLLGAEGWELIGVTGLPTNKWCFKRPKT